MNGGRTTKIIQTRQTNASRQRLYRETRAQYHQDILAQVNALKEKNMNAALYLAMLAQGRLLQPHRYSLLRNSIMAYYADLFEYGVNPLKQLLYRKQMQFLKFHLATDCVLESSKSKGTSVAEYMMNVWATYTTFYDTFSVDVDSIDCLDQEKSAFSLNQTMSMTVTRRAVKLFLPQLLCNYEFMDKVVGKRLNVSIQHHVTFDLNNQIVYVTVQHQIAQGWCQLVNDARLASQVASRLKFDCIVDQYTAHSI